MVSSYVNENTEPKWGIQASLWEGSTLDIEFCCVNSSTMCLMDIKKRASAFNVGIRSLALMKQIIYGANFRLHKYLFLSFLSLFHLSPFVPRLNHLPSLV